MCRHGATVDDLSFQVYNSIVIPLGVYSRRIRAAIDAEQDRCGGMHAHPDGLGSSAALAGEVTGNGKSLKPLQGQSICAYSGLSDDPLGEDPANGPAG